MEKISENKRLRYDRKNHKVIVEWENSGPIKEGDVEIGTSTEKYHQEYDVSKFKDTVKKLNENMVTAQKGIKEAKFKIETTIISSSEEEMQKYSRIIGDTKKFNEVQQAKQTLAYFENELKSLQADKRVVEPIIKQIGK